MDIEELTVEPDAPRSWINDIHDQIDSMTLEASWRRDLLANVHINYDPMRQEYHAELNVRNRRYAIRLDSEQDDVNTRQMLTAQLVQRHMEHHSMPISTPTESIFGPDITEASIPSQATIPQAPPFIIQQNTQATELRVLRDKYPRIIFNYNLQALPRQALQAERDEIITAFRQRNRMKAVLYTLKNTPPKYLQEVRAMLHLNLSNRENRELDANSLLAIENMASHRRTLAAIQHFRERREEFIVNREQYGAQQAEYNQRAAMIRQKPNRPKTINVQEILETVSQWEKVWGVSVKRGTSSGLSIRIGLCNIVMEESADETMYDDPKPITLAPCFFTITINNDGSFVCRSSDGNAAGLSYTANSGSYYYDFHPHQLSDTPCFGSFGQTFIDLAIHGEIIALISGIIAFYSQYNSEDSAGVNARLLHPRNVCPIEHVDNYIDHMHDRLTRWSYHIVDENKLKEATANYMGYHETERHEAAPERIIRNSCYSCEENDVSDGTNYYCDNNGERICCGCWEDHYCSECERHEEDCCCDDNDY